MPRRFRPALGAAAVAAALALPAWCMDLAEAYRLALVQDATIRESRAAARAVGELLPQARAQFLPNISAAAGYGRNQLEITGPDLFGRTTSDFERYRSSDTQLQLRQPILRKQLHAQYALAKAQVADANAQLDRDEQQLVMRVTEAYFNALFAQDQLALVQLQEASYAAQLDAARKAFAAGAGTRTDIDEAQSRLDLAVAQELEARQNVDAMRKKLQAIINQPVTQLAPVDVGRMELAPPVPDSLDRWTQLAEDASPEVGSARAQIEVARADIDKAKSGHYPTLDLVASLARTASENLTNVRNKYYQKQIAVQLSVPLYAGGYVDSQVRQALASLDRAESRLEEVRRDLGVRVNQEFRGVTEGVLKVRALEQAVRSSEQLVLSSRRSFEAGARTRLDILNAEAQAGQARRDLAQARFVYLLSRVRLRALAGGLRGDNIGEINAWLQH